MRVEYSRVSKTKDTGNLDIQHEALTQGGVAQKTINEEASRASKTTGPVSMAAQGAARARYADGVEVPTGLSSGQSVSTQRTRENGTVSAEPEPLADPNFFGIRLAHIP